METAVTETSMQFWDHFEDRIRSYENMPEATTLPDSEKRNAFYNAIIVAVPEIQILVFIYKAQTGKSLSYGALKFFII